MPSVTCDKMEDIMDSCWLSFFGRPGVLACRAGPRASSIHWGGWNRSADDFFYAALPGRRLCWTWSFRWGANGSSYISAQWNGAYIRHRSSNWTGRGWGWCRWDGENRWFLFWCGKSVGLIFHYSEWTGQPELCQICQNRHVRAVRFAGMYRHDQGSL